MQVTVTRSSDVTASRPSARPGAAGESGRAPRNTPCSPVSTTGSRHCSVLEVAYTVRGPVAFASTSSMRSVSYRPYSNRSSAIAPAGPPTPPVTQSANGCGPCATRRASTRIVQSPTPGVDRRTNSSTLSESRTPPAIDTLFAR